MKRHLLILVGTLILLTVTRLNAEVPLMTGYQGRVKVAGTNFTGNGQFKFVLIARPSGASLWSNDGTSVNGSQPSAGVPLSVTDGLFNVLLGDTSLPNMQPLTAQIFTANRDVLLRVWFNDGVNGSVLLTPDTPLASVPYAIASTVPTGSITRDHLAAGAVDPAKLASASAPQAGNVLSYDGTGFNWLDLSVANNTWAPNGASIYYNSGNVGIGTAVPERRLTVQNNFYGIEHHDGTVALSTFLNSQGGWFGTLTDHKLHFYVDDGGPAMTIDTFENVGIGNSSPAAKLDVNGNINYAQLTKLEVADNFVSTVRSADLLLGHSSRRGVPGRALVDFGSSLVVNFGADWPVTVIGGSLETAEAPYVTFRSHDLWLGHSQRRGAPGRALVDFGGDLHLNFAGDWGNTVIGGNLTTIVGEASVRALTIRGGADLAEPFEMPETIAKGSVVVIDENQPGKLKLSTHAYDTRVAGIVSGANGVNPGIALHQEGVLEGGQNVALSGRVYVQADAQTGAISPGDLLTTSDTPGHAMKVLDHMKAQGAILGKAMTSLKSGTGMVLVLVTLQ